MGIAETIRIFGGKRIRRRFRQGYCCRIVLSEAVDGCISFTRKIQHGGDWERSRPQGPKNVQNFLMTVRPLSWVCGHGTEMLLIVKKLFLTWLLPDIFRYDSRKILYAVNLWLKPVSATGAGNTVDLIIFACLNFCEFCDLGTFFVY